MLHIQKRNRWQSKKKETLKFEEKRKKCAKPIIVNGTREQNEKCAKPIIVNGTREQLILRYFDPFFLNQSLAQAYKLRA